MPKYYSYQSGSGGYIQTSIEDTPQILQLAPSVEGLLKELGFEYGEYVPRDITKPLVILGVLETTSGGLSKAELLSGMPKLSVEYCELTIGQQTTLEDYLRSRINDLTGPTREKLDSFLSNESPLDQLPKQPKPAGTLQNDKPTGSPITQAAELDLTPIPSKLKKRDQWLCWREETRAGKPTKVPVSPHDRGFGKVNDSSTWASFQVAVDALSRDDVTGLGFVFTDNDTIAGVDLDAMRDPETGSLSERAQDIVSRLDSYTEVSPSGTGLHVLLHGFVPDGRSRSDGIEIYDTGRFFTVTGDHLSDTPTEIAVRQNELATVHAEHVAQDERQTAEADRSTDEPKSSTNKSQIAKPETDLNEDEITTYGNRNAKFRRLWEGDWSGYESQSEADLAFCILLAYYTGDDTDLMDTVFRRSELMRPKWDEMRGDQTYGEMTLEKAVRIVDSYDPHLHGMDAAAPETVIARLEPEQKATIEATVDSVDKIPAEEIEQAGELEDDTGSIRFVVWASEYWDPEVEFTAGVTYRLADVWVTEYQGQREIHVNEHTAIEEI